MRPYNNDFAVGFTRFRLRWLSWPVKRSGLAPWWRVSIAGSAVTSFYGDTLARTI